MGFAPSRRHIKNADDLDVEIHEGFDLYPNGKPCFYCHQTLGDAADDRTVYWSGSTTEIYLHPVCAIQLGTHLIKDGMIAESDTTLDSLFRGTPWFDPSTDCRPKTGDRRSEGRDKGEPA